MSAFTRILATIWAMIFAIGCGTSAYFGWLVGVDRDGRLNGFMLLSAACFVASVITAGISILGGEDV